MEEIELSKEDLTEIQTEGYAVSMTRDEARALWDLLPDDKAYEPLSNAVDAAQGAIATSATAATFIVIKIEVKA